MAHPIYQGFYDQFNMGPGPEGDPIAQAQRAALARKLRVQDAASYGPFGSGRDAPPFNPPNQTSGAKLAQQAASGKMLADQLQAPDTSTLPLTNMPDIDATTAQAFNTSEADAAQPSAVNSINSGVGAPAPEAPAAPGNFNYDTEKSILAGKLAGYGKLANLRQPEMNTQGKFFSMASPFASIGTGIASGIGGMMQQKTIEEQRGLDDKAAEAQKQILGALGGQPGPNGEAPKALTKAEQMDMIINLGNAGPGGKQFATAMANQIFSENKKFDVQVIKDKEGNITGITRTNVNTGEIELLDGNKMPGSGGNDLDPSKYIDTPEGRQVWSKSQQKYVTPGGAPVVSAETAHKNEQSIKEKAKQQEELNGMEASLAKQEQNLNNLKGLASQGTDNISTGWVQDLKKGSAYLLPDQFISNSVKFEREWNQFVEKGVLDLISAASSAQVFNSNVEREAAKNSFTPVSFKTSSKEDIRDAVLHNVGLYEDLVAKTKAKIAERKQLLQSGGGQQTAPPTSVGSGNIARDAAKAGVTEEVMAEYYKSRGK